jgi:hypothetical protein
VPASGSLNVGASSGFTIEGWINPQSVSSQEPIAEWQGGSGVQFWLSAGGGPGSLYASIVDTSGGSHSFNTGSGVVVANQFQHVALTYDKGSGVAKLYVNGIAVTTANLGTFTPQTSGSLALGARTGQIYWAGLLDEISLYNVALTSSQIAAIYNAGSAGKCLGGAVPFITAQPTNQTTVLDGAVIFSVAAVSIGTAPLSYQWYFNGTNAIAGATNTTLPLLDVSFSDAGVYAVSVSNLYGSVFSSNAVLTVNPSPPCAPVQAGLISWWLGEGNANDTVGTNSGVLVGGVSFAPGEVGEAFSFNGSNAYVSVPASSSLNVGASGGFTIEGWINPQSVGSQEPIAEWQGGSGVQFWISTGGGSGSLYANIVDTSGGSHSFNTGSGFVLANQFQHVALTYDKRSGVGILYVNGVAAAAASLGTFTPQTSGSLTLGARVGQTYWAGLLDEISLYNVALTPSEITAIYDVGNGGKCQSSSIPIIIVQPNNKTVVVGDGVTFDVAAIGTPPLGYQWLLNGTNEIAGATNTTLQLFDVSLSNAGVYSVLVSNLYGSVFSSNAVLTVNSGPPCAQVQAGLVSWWAGEGDASDAVGTNNGVIIGGVGFALGEVGEAFSLNGSNGYIFVPASGSLNVGATNGFTIEGWINPQSVSSQEPIAEWNGGNGVEFWISTGGGSGSLYANIVDTSGGSHSLYTSSGVVVANQFQHVALTYDKGSGVAKLYVNGIAVTTANLGTFTPQTSGNLALGARTGQIYWAGLLDEISLYNVALASSQIAAIYNAGSAGKCLGGTVVPLITTQPTNQTAFVGGEAIFSVAAVSFGTAPLSYQWYFNGTNAIAGATNTTLPLLDVSFSDAGVYAVSVSNLYGSVFSSNAVLTVNPPPPCAPLQAGLVSWWPGEGNANDIAGTNNGLIVGGINFVPGEVGQAFSLNGSGQYVSVLASSSLNVGASSGFTIEGWINPQSVSSQEPIAEWNGGNGVEFWISAGGGSGCLYAQIIDTSGSGHAFSSSAGAVVANQFQHVALTYDKASGMGKLYLNGGVVATANLGTFTPQTSGNLALGARTGQIYWAGLLDEISLYKVALTSSQVAAIYNAGNAGKCGGSGGLLITTQPTNQTTVPGGAVIFSVAAAGKPPLSYQWYFNGTNAIAGATNTTLSLLDVSFGNAGVYAVLVSNVYGSAFSSNAVLTVNSGPPCAPVQAGLVSWWPGEGDASDNIETNNGVLVGGVSFAPGEVGEAFSLNGSNALISVQGSSSLNIGASNGFTIEGWINPQNVTSQEPIAEWNGGNGVEFWISAGGGSGCLYAQLIDTNGGGHAFSSSAGFVAANQFQHVALTYDKVSGVGTLYLNGGVVATANLGTFTPKTTGNLVLGARAGQVYWAGLLDEISLYNVALTSSQIAAIYNAGNVGKCQVGPTIYTQPSNQSVSAGDTATFSVAASGTKPLNYLWYQNGTNIDQTANGTLVLTNVQLSASGLYNVVVSNSYGAVASTNAMLQVIPYGAPIILVNGQIVYFQSVSEIGSAQIQFAGGFPDGIIFYTLDGSAPTAGSPIYTGPITLTNSATVQAMSMSSDFTQSSQAIPVNVQIVPTYALQTSVIGSGGVSVSPSGGLYPSNSVVMLAANPAQYWAFDHWLGGAIGSSNPLNVTMNGPLSIQAVFVPTAYPLTVSTPGGGSVTANGQIIAPATYYPAGSTVNVAAIGSNGWSFVGWQGTANGANNPINVLMDQTNNLQAIFGTTMGVNAVGGGSVVLSQPNPVPFGTTITASAVPNSGKYFVTWGGAVSGTNSPALIVVTNAAPSVNALFTALPAGKYALNVVVYGGGEVQVSPQQRYYNLGDAVTLTATATNSGIMFYGWAQDATGTNNPLTLFVATNTIIQAHFAGYPTGTLLIQQVGQDIQIAVTNIYPNHWSVLEGAENFGVGTNTAWVIISTNTVGIGGMTAPFTDTNAITLYPHRFYRIYSY